MQPRSGVAHRHPERGGTELSRWLASEASVTTGNSRTGSWHPARGAGRGSADEPVVTLASVANHRLIFLAPLRGAAFGTQNLVTASGMMCTRAHEAAYKSSLFLGPDRDH